MDDPKIIDINKCPHCNGSCEVGSMAYSKSKDIVMLHTRCKECDSYNLQYMNKTGEISTIDPNDRGD